MALVPHRKIKYDAWEQSIFDNAKEEPNHKETSQVLADTDKSGNDAKEDGKSRQPKPRRRPFENDVARYLEQHIPNEVKSQTSKILITGYHRC